MNHLKLNFHHALDDYNKLNGFDLVEMSLDERYKEEHAYEDFTDE